MPLVQSGIPALVGGFVTAMFLRGNTSRQEFEKIKAGKINEVIDALVESRELTLTELVKCKNMLTIAKLADEQNSKNNTEKEHNSGNNTYDFGWFLRFFEAAGNVTDKEMQTIWAKVLANEVRDSGKVHPAFIEIMKQLNLFDVDFLSHISKNSMRNKNALDLVHDGIVYLLAELHAYNEIKHIRLIPVKPPKYRIISKTLKDYGFVNQEEEYEQVLELAHVSFDNLIRLNIIEVGEDISDAPTPRNDDNSFDFQVEKKSFKVRLTHFGISFCDIVMPQHKGNEIN